MSPYAPASHVSPTRQALDAARPSAHRRGYDARWRERRRLYLLHYPLCGMRANDAQPVLSRCHDTQTITAATVVDHVEPHRGDHARFHDEANWQALCASCHSAKTRAGL